MKKTLKKLLSILMVFAMLFGMVPTQAFAADETIDTISATVTLPVEGANPVETGTPGDSSYKIIRVRFSEKDPETGSYTSLESTDTFEAGKTYMVNVLFRANSGYAIDRNTVSASINGQTAAWWGAISDGYGSQYFYIEYTVPEEITSISVNVPKPVAGGTADINGITISPAALSISDAEWRINKDGVGLVPVDKFTAGKTYYLVISYDVAEGYVVSNSAAISHNLTGGEIAHNSSNKTVIIEYTVEAEAPKTYTITFDANGGSDTMTPITGVSGEYTLPLCTFTPPAGKQFKCWGVGPDAEEYDPLDKINITADTTIKAVWEPDITPVKIGELSATVTEPFAGQPISFEAIVGGEGYTVTVEWEDDDCQIYPEDEAKFEEGKQYFLVVMFSAKPGYVFAEDARVVINDKTPDDKEIEETSAYGLLTFIAAAPPAPKTITELSATVAEPVAGEPISFEAIAGGEGYTATVEWEDDDCQIYPEDEAKFEEGKQYFLAVMFSAKPGYVFAEDALVVINDKTPEDKEVEETSAYGLLTFAPKAVSSIESVKLSDITEPVIGATPDFDITLTGEAAFDEEEGKGWWKVEPETYHWELMDEETPFSAGTYCLEVNLKAEDEYKFTEDTKFYYGDNELSEFNGSIEHNYELYGKDYASIYLYFTLESATPVQPAVALNESAITLTAGETATLVPTITPADLSNYALSWTSDDESVATVDSDGKVTAVAPGTATITVTLNNNVSRSTAALAQPTATCVVTVVPQDVPQEPTTSVTVIKVWDDNNNANRPTSVRVAIYANGEKLLENVLSDRNNWTWTEELPAAMGDGTPIAYTVDELEVPDGYEKTVKETDVTAGIGFTITNTLVEEDDKENEEGGNGGATTPTTPSAPSTPSVPDTSDNTNTLMYLTSLICAAAARVAVVIYRRKRSAE